MALSPMMQQYMEIKEQYSDCLLMFRLGDFYELFFDDAKVAARELELALTGKNCGLEERAPMCGVPHHSASSYIIKLVKKDYKVAICEQVEDPKDAVGIVKRKVVRVYTPGTLDLPESEEQNENVYIAALTVNKNKTAAGIAYADLTTGQLSAIEITDDLTPDLIASQITKVSPKELLLSNATFDIVNAEIDLPMLNTYVNQIDASYFKDSNCEKAIKHQFHTESLLSLDLAEKTELISAVGALILYLTETQKASPEQITALEIVNPDDYMQLDRATIRNLELTETIYDGKTKGSLFGVLDRTKTAMGGRLIKRYIKEPLKSSEMINLRLNAVENLKADSFSRNELRELLGTVYDFERLTARIAGMKANGKDLIALKTSIDSLPEIRKILLRFADELLCGIVSDISDFTEISSLIERSIKPEPPFTIKDGDLIRDGFNEELDSLKASIKDAKEWILSLESKERERTGIKTIKVGFNKVFGYYIDVSKSFIDMVPEEYIRKQTLVNNERYITPELKEKEQLVLKAESQINDLEYRIFKEIRDTLSEYIVLLQRASKAIAILDVLISFADVAAKNNYVKPNITDDGIINISMGRHPAVEQLIEDGIFVSNDVKIDKDEQSMLIITGPNMAGKSTYMRQTAIIVLMAQIGSFVPAEQASIGIVDRIFTRIGASDNLSRGQSTFFIEMSELAHIVRSCTENSLIILDEIGRGTSTFDGLSIAWATVEYLCSSDHSVRTLFATHYHELTELALTHSNIKNLSVAVTEQGKDIVFLHKIVEGPASKSYGIHVAKIAGLPASIRTNAQKKLRQLEESQALMSGASSQISLFEEEFTSGDAEISELQEIQASYTTFIDRLLDVNINDLTPLQAINVLKELQDEAAELEK